MKSEPSLLAAALLSIVSVLSAFVHMTEVQHQAVLGAVAPVSLLLAAFWVRSQSTPNVKTVERKEEDTKP